MKNVDHLIGIKKELDNMNKKEIKSKVEELIKRYNIPKENIVSSRASLNWLFLENKNESN